MAPNWAIWIGDTLRALPAPTDSWAKIIASLAWPALVGFILIRFRKYIRLFLDTIAKRMQTDHFKIGPFEMTPNSTVIPLDPKDASQSTDDYAPDDIGRIEKLFEFIGDTANLHKLAAWVNEKVDSTLEISDFVTAPEYASQRKEAVERFIGTQK